MPLSFAFAMRGERVIAIHRTEWNRLDITDAAKGTLLSVRGPTSYGAGEEGLADGAGIFDVTRRGERGERGEPSAVNTAETTSGAERAHAGIEKIEQRADPSRLSPVRHCEMLP